MTRVPGPVVRQRIVIFSIFVLFFVPMWIVLPALNEYIIARRCEALHDVFASTGPVCGGKDVSASAQSWYTRVNLSCNIPSLLVCFQLGSFADRLGRRPVLMWCLGTQLIGALGLMITCLMKLDLLWFMPGFVVNGFGGGSFTLQTVLLSSLADGSDTEKVRSVLLARATAMYYICGAIGPLVGGYVSQAHWRVLPNLEGDQYQLAFIIFFVTNAMVLTLGIVGFSETLPGPLQSAGVVDGRMQELDAPRNERCLLKAAFVGMKNMLRSRVVVVVSVIFMLLSATINTAMSGLLVTYSKLSMFSMSDATTGWFIFLPWLVRASAAALIFPSVLPRLQSMIIAARMGRPRNSGQEQLSTSYKSGASSNLASLSVCIACLWCVRMGALFSICIFACFGFAGTSAALFALCTTEGFAAIWDPACSVLLSQLAEMQKGRDGDVDESDAKHVSKQGEFMGLRALLQLSVGVVGPVVFNAIYDATVAWVQPFVFYTLGGCCAVGFALTWVVHESDL